MRNSTGQGQEGPNARTVNVDLFHNNGMTQISTTHEIPEL